MPKQTLLFIACVIPIIFGATSSFGWSVQDNSPCQIGPNCQSVPNSWVVIPLAAAGVALPQMLLGLPFDRWSLETNLGLGTHSSAEFGILFANDVPESRWRLVTLADVQLHDSQEPVRTDYGIGGGLDQNLENHYSEFFSLGVLAETYETRSSPAFGVYVLQRLVKAWTPHEHGFLEVKATDTQWLVWRVTAGLHFREGPESAGAYSLALSYEENDALHLSSIILDFGFFHW